MSILALQQRLVEVGRIRMGEKRTSQQGKTYPAKLGTWRLTSPDVQRLRAVADVYGGEVKAWEDQHEVITTSEALDIALIPGQALSQHMEHWGQEGPKKPVICMRRCDGERELLLDRPCPCKVEAGNDGDLLCKPTTHLMVMLRQVPGIGSWRLSTRGWYAAQELLGTAGLLEQLTARGQLVPARLRLDQRTVTKADGNKNFVVPVIDIDVALDAVLGGMALGVGGGRVLDAPAVAELEAPKAAPFTPVPVEQLPPAPTASTREQLAVVAPAGRRRANAAEPIKATGLRPGGGASAAAPVGGSVDGTESPLTDGPVPSAAAEPVAGEAKPAISAEQGASDRPPAASSAAVELVNEEGAQKVAMWCADAGIDDSLRPMFLYAFGGITSAKAVPVDKLGSLRETLDRVKRGQLELVSDPDGMSNPFLRIPGADSSESRTALTAPPASIMWKQLVGQTPGIGFSKFMRQVKVECEQRGLPAATVYDDIPAVLNDVLRSWLAEQVAA